MAAIEMNDAAIEVVEQVLDHYLQEVDTDNIDTADLAENIVMALDSSGRKS